MNIKLCLVRPPVLSTYHDTDIKEDPMLTGILGYLDSINWKGDFEVFDYHIDKTINSDSLFHKPFTHYVLTVRDQGECYLYAKRLANYILEKTNAIVYFYGQVAPLRQIKSFPPRLKLINQSEKELAKAIGLSDQGASFEGNLQVRSYFPHINLEPWQKKALKAAIETTRGCTYRCRFCYIAAGQSFEKPWTVRPKGSILNDIQMYYNKGFRRFTFLDSEFLGHHAADHAQKKTLLLEMKERFPDIKYMIWCRGNTLEKFNEFDLLKESGLSKVLMGVESFYDQDLKALNKGVQADTTIKSIKELISRKIHCALTFLTFHRNTTIESLEYNLKVWEDLHRSEFVRYLGLPNFTMNIEISRTENRDQPVLKEISNRTYIRPIMWHRGQEDFSKVTFPIEMEPLVELYRILGYEWVVKKCELIREYRKLSDQDQQLVDKWFDTLGMFCVKTMQAYLEEFKVGKLTLDSLNSFRDDILERIRAFYEVLPISLRSLPTEERTKKLDYNSVVLSEDHGWNNKIPILSEEESFTAPTLEACEI